MGIISFVNFPATPRVRWCKGREKRWFLPLLLLFFTSNSLATTTSELMRSRAQLAYTNQQYEQALEWLEQALQEDSEDRVARYYLGMVYAKLNDKERALSELTLVGEEAALGAAAIYARSEILIRLGRDDEALQLLNLLKRRHPESQYARRGDELAKGLKEVEGSYRNWEADLTLGAMHDSNVALYSTELPLPTTLSDRGDNRWQMGVDLKWQPLVNSAVPLTLGYKFFQSRHQELSDYDLRNHVVHAMWKKTGGQSEWGANYQYLQASLNNFEYMHGHSLTPYLMLLHEKGDRSLLKVQYRDEQYDYPNLQGYDGSRFHLSYRYFHLLSENRYLSVGVEGGSDQTDDSSLAAQRYGVNSAVQWNWGELQATFNMSYLLHHYPDALLERSDTVLKTGLRFSYPVARHAHLEASVSSIDNASDNSQYDYDRQVYGITLKWKLQ